MRTTDNGLTWTRVDPLVDVNVQAIEIAGNKLAMIDVVDLGNGPVTRLTIHNATTGQILSYRALTSSDGGQVVLAEPTARMSLRG